MALNTYLSKTLLHLLEKGVAKNNLLEKGWAKITIKLCVNLCAISVGFWLHLFPKGVFWPNLLSKGCIYEPPKNITLCFR